MVDYACFVLVIIAVYVILGVSLNLIIGFTGLFSLAHAAFMGIGAYTATMLMLNQGWNFFLTMPAGFAIAGISSALLGMMILRVKGEEYIIASLGFQAIIYGFFLNAVEITRGPNGFFNIPKPTIFGYTLSSPWSLLIMATVVAAICVFIFRRLGNSAFGQVLRAIREDEIAAESLGKNIAFYKITAFAIGSGFAAVGGSIYATAVGFIDPFGFELFQSVLILAIVVIGGAGNVWGAVVGATILYLLPEALKLFHMSEAVAGPVRSMMFGILLLLFMMFRPQGILPERLSARFIRRKSGNRVNNGGEQ